MLYEVAARPDTLDWIVAFIAVAGVPLLAAFFIMLRQVFS